MTALLLRVLPWAALLGVAWFGGCEYQKNRELDAQVSALEKRNADLEDEVGRVDSVYVTDTLVLTKWRTHYDSLLDTVRVHDTLWVRKFMWAAGETIQACENALATCEGRVALRDSMIENLEKQVTLEKKRSGTDWKLILGALLVGAAADRLIPR